MTRRSIRPQSRSTRRAAGTDLFGEGRPGRSSLSLGNGAESRWDPRPVAAPGRGLLSWAAGRTSRRGRLLGRRGRALSLGSRLGHRRRFSGSRLGRLGREGGLVHTKIGRPGLWQCATGNREPEQSRRCGKDAKPHENDPPPSRPVSATLRTWVSATTGFSRRRRPRWSGFCRSEFADPMSTITSTAASAISWSAARWSWDMNRPVK